MRLAQSLVTIALALGAQAGAHLGKHLAMSTGATSLLRLICKTPDTSVETPRVLGLDDFALDKGRTYGTILVDLERHRPVDLLPDRRAETVAAWLTNHGIEIISRDRSTEYSRGIALGAPAAQQVADRFHIVANLRQALERQLDHERAKFVGIELPAAGPTGQLPPNASAARRQPGWRTSSEIRSGQRGRPGGQGAVRVYPLD